MENKDNIQHIKEILSKLPVINKTTFKNIPPSIIINEICNYYNISFEYIRAKTNKKEIVEPRQVITYFIKKYTKKEKISHEGKIKDVQITNKDVATIINKASHATVLHSVRSIENQTNTNKQFNFKIEELDKKIKQYEF